LAEHAEDPAQQLPRQFAAQAMNLGLEKRLRNPRKQPTEERGPQHQTRKYFPTTAGCPNRRKSVANRRAASQITTSWVSTGRRTSSTDARRSASITLPCWATTIGIEV